MPDMLEMLDSYPDATIILGDDAFSQFEELVTSRTPARVMLFTGKNSISSHNGMDRLFRCFNNHQAEIRHYSDIEPEPCVETILRMRVALEEFQPDMVIAMGGGSPMDAAKAASLLWQCGGAPEDYFGLNRWSSANPGKTINRIICFPTTAGTGSEVTQYSNIVDHSLKVKKLIVETAAIPEYAFICPELSMSAPPHVTLATACDALAHLLEGFLNVGQDNVHPQANDWAFEGIRLILQYLEARQTDPANPIPARMLAAAATLGGMTIRYKPTGLPHLCSFSWFGHIPHGLAVAMLLPAAWSYYLDNPAVAERTMRLKELFPGSASPMDIIRSYRNFLSLRGVPESLSALTGFPRRLLADSAAAGAQNPMKLELAPRRVPLEQSREILMDILEKSWQGKF